MGFMYAAHYNMIVYLLQMKIVPYTYVRRSVLVKSQSTKLVIVDALSDLLTGQIGVKVCIHYI